ncbi:hypothetical protein ALP8811_00654 [Aliiroseovarius pelagivivens]|uniref:Lipoprotein n=1 Tax=Aliiroseovarius pelagivivens TaxID=1639690 RepID=A0A2R8AHY1_9RHOB|nr:hypothetical protein [Aliiroseovarius pelagivivens]SPF75661.1 hypothetical protein ALP8811_00654 [Aliiroseovarius pelagivivens]
MRFIPAHLAVVAVVALSACQSDQGNVNARGGASFCDRLIEWQKVEGKEGTKRAVTRPEICALSQPGALWFRSKQVSGQLKGREYWLLVPPNDPHISQNAITGWDLQVRPFSYAHEFFLVRKDGARLQPAIAQNDCPRKAVGLEGVKGGKRYCLTN